MRNGLRGFAVGVLAVASLLIVVAASAQTYTCHIDAGQATATITAVPDTNWNVVRVAGFQGGGKADIVWRNSATGANSIWLMDGTSIAVSAALPAVPDTNWKIGGPQSQRSSVDIRRC